MARFEFMSLDGRPGGSADSSYSNGLVTINSDSVKAYWCFQPKEPATITHLGVNFYAVNGTPAQYRVSLRTLLSDGLPSSTLMASKVFTPEASWAGTFQWIELLTPFKVRRGEKIVMVLEYYSGYISTNNSITICGTIGSAHSRHGNFPYFIHWTGAASRSGAHLVYGMKSSSRCYGFPIKGWAYETTNSPAEIGIRFMLSSEYGTIYKLNGIGMEGRLQSAAGNSVDIILYDSFNTVLNRVTIDCDVGEAPTAYYGTYEFIFDDETLASLTFGKEYFLAFSPNGASMNFALTTWETEEIEDATAFPGGSAFYLVTRASSAAGWTRVRNKRPQIDLYIDDWAK